MDKDMTPVYVPDFTKEEWETIDSSICSLMEEMLWDGKETILDRIRSKINTIKFY